MFHVEQTHTQLLAQPKDHLVSGEHFEIRLDVNTHVAATHPRPNKEKLPDYYASNEYISHGNNKKSLTDQLYSVVQRIMFAKKRKWMSRHSTPSASYLDFGCGTGDFVNSLAERGWISHGIEPNEKARTFNPTYKNVYASLGQLPSMRFDIIGLWHVLEHLPDPKETLSALEKKLTHGGIFFIALPNFNSFDAKHYKDFWAAYDVPRHLWHFSAKGIEKLMQALGYEMIEQRGLFFDAIYVSYLSEKQQKKSGALLRGLFWGLYSNLKALRSGEYSSLVYVFKRKN